jgi:hypothetical protein
MELNYGGLSYNFSLTPKYFYNRRSRIEKGKESTLNGGNYFGLRIKYVTANYNLWGDYGKTFLANVHWGIQRPLGKRFTFNCHAGAGYAENLDDHGGTFYPSVDFKFSFVLFGSKTRS